MRKLVPQNFAIYWLVREEVELDQV
jgi:hypothetical protein